MAVAAPSSLTTSDAAYTRIEEPPLSAAFQGPYIEGVNSQRVMDMHGPRAGFKAIGGFWAGILIGLVIVTPVFAATSAEPLSTYDVLLLVLGALLLVGLALEAIVGANNSPESSYLLPDSSARRHADEHAFDWADQQLA